MQREGFSLVEMLMVTAVIALLCAIAVPSYIYYTERKMLMEYGSQLRLYVQAFELYKMEEGDYPPDGTPSSVVPGMADYFEAVRVDRAGSDWVHDRPLGGQWDWDMNQFGFTAGISVYAPTIGRKNMIILDQLIDDGNVATGRFRQRNNGYIYVIAP